MIRSSKVLSGAIAIAATLILLAGCSGGGAGDSAAEPGAEADAGTEPVVLEISPEAAAILAQADLADGTEDHVVEKCATCGLAMDGKAEYSLQVGEYEMHFCSDACSRSFKKDVEASVLNLPQP